MPPPVTMDKDEFNEFGKKTVDFIVDYRENIKTTPVISTMEPGYLAKVLPGN